MDYFLTGSTGLVGSHVLFELLNHIHTQKSESRIFLLVRGTKDESPEDRIKRVLYNEDAPDFVHALPLDQLLGKIECVESDLNNPDLPVQLQLLNSNSLTVIHSAASTNLMQGPNAEQDVYENNFKGTLSLLNSLKSLNVRRFTYISTAFSCGMQDQLDLIGNDYLTYPVNGFRNPYEGHKNEIEKILKADCDERGIDLQILRPAVVCGRLMDTPFYKTTKFDVFYGWAKFFYGRREKIGDSKFRISINPEGTQNIVPVDYVAKVIAKAIHMDNIEQLNIVSENPPLHKEYFAKILDEIGIPNYEFVDEIPEDLSVWETLYYKSAGRVFEPYICNKNMVFDTQVLSTQFGEFKFNDVLQNFGELIQFAISRQFIEPNHVVPAPKNGSMIKMPSATEKYALRNQA